MTNKGPFEVDEETSRRIRDTLLKQTGLDKKITAGQSRFPEVETDRGIPKETITVKELKQRLKEMGATKYSHMSKDQLWQYIKKKRAEQRLDYRQLGKDLIKEIDKENEARKKHIGQYELF